MGRLAEVGRPCLEAGQPQHSSWVSIVMLGWVVVAAGQWAGMPTHGYAPNTFLEDFVPVIVNYYMVSVTIGHN